MIEKLLCGRAIRLSCRQFSAPILSRFMRLIYGIWGAIMLSLTLVACTTSDLLRGRTEDTANSTPVQSIDLADAPYARQLDAWPVPSLAPTVEQPAPAVTQAGLPAARLSSPQRGTELAVFARQLDGLSVHDLAEQSEPVIAPAGLPAVTLPSLQASSEVAAREPGALSVPSLAEQSEPVIAPAGLPAVTLPSLQPGTEVAALARAAIRESDLASPGLDLIERRILERIATGRDRWPQITPIAGIDEDGDSQAGLRTTLTLFDFGRSRARQAQADRAIELAQLDLWQERIDSVRDALGVLIDASRAQALRDASALSLIDVTEMRQFAESRVGAGITDQSEQILYDVRLAELRNEINADTAALELALGQIAVSTRRVFTDASVPALAAIEAALLPAPAGSGAQELARARLQYRIAEHQLRLVRARRFPTLLLRGTALFDGSDVSSTASLAIEGSDFLGLATQPSVQAARSALASAQARVAQVARELQIEARRIALERMRLESRAVSLKTLLEEARVSVSLFLQQQDIGGRPLTDGITVYRTLLDTERRLVLVRAELLRLHLEDAVQRGTLVIQGPQP